MKKQIKKTSEEAILKRFPIKSKIEGWYFSIRETSNLVYSVTGSDLFGREISLHGSDEPEDLIKQCEIKISKLN